MKNRVPSLTPRVILTGRECSTSHKEQSLKEALGSGQFNCGLSCWLATRSVVLSTCTWQTTATSLPEGCQGAAAAAVAKAL